MIVSRGRMKVLPLFFFGFDLRTKRQRVALEWFIFRILRSSSEEGLSKGTRSLLGMGNAGLRVAVFFGRRVAVVLE
jgi:hypothetical protein